MLTVKPTVVKNRIDEDRLERFVKGDDRKTGGIEQGVEQREAQSADKRSGHAEAPERRELSRQRSAEPVHNGAEREGMVHIELDLSHGVVPPVLFFRWDGIRRIAAEGGIGLPAVRIEWQGTGGAR